MGLPFNNGVTSSETVFASLGSVAFLTADPVDALVLETLGSGFTTVSWGGQTVLAGTPQEYIGARISQAGINFDGLGGSVSISEPAAFPMILFLACGVIFPLRNRN